jgi:hypothetical protein
MLEALRSSAAQVRDLVLEQANRSSSLATSLSLTAGLLEGCIDAVAANGVHWGTQSALATALSHFSESGAELELLGSGHNADLTEDQVDALWTQVCPTSDLLVSYVPPSVARGPPGVTGE